MISLLLASASALIQPERPNILWITWEDAGPHLGCYGDTYATTPHLDQLASAGMAYERAWSNVPVCAPARTTLITGMHAASLGALPMRSTIEVPESIDLLPQIMRRNGYYCTNRAKTDYNIIPHGKVWDESSGKAHWRNREPGQPFFAVFNFTQSHESQIRRRPHKAVHDPAKAVIPPYWPDLPEIRQDWAQYYDKVTEIDSAAGRVLAQLDEDGLRDNTIIFAFADHGSGMPRHKRMPYDSGLRVPLIVSVPEKWRHLAPQKWMPGGMRDEMAGFVDLAPSVLQAAGIEAPERMQGRSILAGNEPKALQFGYRDRMDEREDFCRTVTDGRFVYVRNFLPHKPHGQHYDYGFKTPTTVAWHNEYLAGHLTPAQASYWQPRPPEELFDLQTDPFEIHNLAEEPQFKDDLARMREHLSAWMIENSDKALLPESLRHRLSEGSTQLELTPDYARLFDAADYASRRVVDEKGRLKTMLDDEDPAVRYWAVIGLIVRSEPTVKWAEEELLNHLVDPASVVRIATAEALILHGSSSSYARALDVLLAASDVRENGHYEVVQALNAIDAAGSRAKPIWSALLALPREKEGVPRRENPSVGKLMEQIERNAGITKPETP